MQNLIKRLLFLLPILIALPSFCHSQLRELGTGAPGPVKAPHLTAELISDSRTINPGGKARVALALTLEPGWHVYWVYAGIQARPRKCNGQRRPEYLLGRCSLLLLRGCLSDP